MTRHSLEDDYAALLPAATAADVEIKIRLALRQPGMQHADVSGVWPRGR